MTEPRANRRRPDDAAGARARTVRARPDTSGTTVVVCTGPACTAPTHHHHPDDTLRRLGPAVAATSGGILIRSLGCLGACPHAPIAVVNQRDALVPNITVWFTIDAPCTVAQIAEWVQAGGPGTASMPAHLDKTIITIQ